MNTLPTAIAAALEIAINGVLQLDPETVARLDTVQGKVIAIELRGLNVALYLLPQHDSLTVFAHFEGEPDTVLRGTPVALARMGLAQHAGDVLFKGDVEISGDVELGQQFRNILDGLDIDWEEHLSRFTGDVVAHQLGELMRSARQWGQQSMDTLGRDAAEYLQEERRELPNPAEVEDLLSQVDTLRSDTDRLEARILRLEKQRENQGNAS
jgi:ubiquinone biosynthesis protein UbiJ